MELQPTAFAPGEIEAVLRRYDLGAAPQVRPFKAGSSLSPKALVDTQRGTFLLKRRAPGRDDPIKVAFAHELQVYLRQRQFPLPHLQGTAVGNNTMLQLHNAVYEVFEYLPASPYDHSEAAARDAGRVLALYHKLLAKYQARFEPPAGCIHHHADVYHTLNSRLKAFRKRVQDVPTEYLDEMRALLGALLDYYQTASGAADALGIAQWPRQITHADWHPSNVLFIEHVVVGVIDFDSARVQQRAVDVANAAVQFCTHFDALSNPMEWPPEINLQTFRAFLEGYDSVQVLSLPEVEAIPHLMIEAIIAEPVLAARRARDLEGFDAYAPWLAMARRKAEWIRSHHETAVTPMLKPV